MQETDQISSQDECEITDCVLGSRVQQGASGQSVLSAPTTHTPPACYRAGGQFQTDTVHEDSATTMKLEAPLVNATFDFEQFNIASSKWENTAHKETGCQDVDWIQLHRDSYQSAGPCELGNDTSAYIKGGKCIN
jgi:hypothetical protein